MCCRLNHNSNMGGPVCKAQQGFKKQSMCLVCVVTLCNVVRYGEKTCFEMFHEIEDSNDQCCIDGTPAKVKRVVHNLVQPPSVGT